MPLFTAIRYRPKKQIRVWIPTFDMAGLSKPDAAAWILSSVYRLVAQNKGAADSMNVVARLCAEPLLHVLGCKYKRYLQELIDLAILRPLNHYRPGKCKAFAIGDVVASRATKKYIIKDATIVRHIN